MSKPPAPLPQLTLQEWDELIGYHLHAIEAGAEMILSHTRQLFGVPEWETRAEEQLDITTSMLSKALLQAEKARQEFRGKPYVR